jgi:hypothetical protein
MVSTQTQIVNRARKRQAAAAAASSSAAFDKKQSAFARRSEEKRVFSEVEPSSKFDLAQSRSATRTPRQTFGGGRQSKFNLNESTGPTVEDELGALLGRNMSAPEPTETNVLASSKSERHDRFDEVISATRKKRVDLQQERDERNKETDELDAEYSSMMHLLQKRDKRQEEIDEFQTLGRQDVRKLLADHAVKRSSTTGRRFVLGDDGSLAKLAPEAAPSTEPTKPTKVSRSEVLPSAAAAVTLPKATVAPAVVHDKEDDFDTMLGSFKMELKRAQPGQRVLSAEEEAVREVQTQLLQMDREQRPMADRAMNERSRAEWVAEGGDNAFHMNEAEFLGDAPLSRAPQQAHAVDAILSQLEELVNNVGADEAELSTHLSSIASDLWHAAVKQKKHAEESFKLVLIDCQRYIYKHRPLTAFHKAAMYLATKVFPTTDFRHPVITPLMLLLSSLCMQTRLETVEACRDALFYASLLLAILSSTKRFASEPIVVALNVMAMQLPRSTFVPVEHGASRCAFPVLGRSDAAVLDLSRCPPSCSPKPLSVCGTSTDGIEQAKLDTSAAAYHLLLNAAEMYADSPSFDAMFGTSFVQSYHRIARQAVRHPAVEELHRKVVERVAMYVAETAMNRTPLAMRMFRPRPLRLYEPLLGDDTPDEKKELRQMKKEYHEDHKRVMRTLQAEGRVEQRGREAEQAADDARRKAKLNTIMAELQQQQHIMKTADTLKTKATMKKRASVNSVPKGKRNQDDD